MTQNDPGTDPSKAKHISVNINLNALRGNFLGRIQELLDIVIVLVSGIEKVAKQDFINNQAFGRVEIGGNQKLSFENAKKESTKWLATNFLTDSINLAGNFLDECIQICSIYQLANKEVVLGEEYLKIENIDRSTFHKLNFPGKFQHLKDEFDVHTVFEEHFLSINKARNCLVHRRGKVSDIDVNDGDNLTIKWRKMELVYKPKNSEEETIIDSPIGVEKGGTISVRFSDIEKSFTIGEEISMEKEELFQLVHFMLSFASSLVESVEQFGKEMGLSNKTTSDSKD